jgi:hypothetical protein
MRAGIGRNAELAVGTRLQAVERLLWLYDDAPATPPEQVSPAEAVRASELYASLYHHAVPFSRKALAKLWQICEADPKQQQACFTARMNLKRTLGDLGV